MRPSLGELISMVKSKQDSSSQEHIQTARDASDALGLKPGLKTSTKKKQPLKKINFGGQRFGDCDIRRM